MAVGSTMTNGQVLQNGLGSQGGCHMGKGGQKLQLEFLGGIQILRREKYWQAYPPIKTNILTEKFLNVCLSSSF